MKFLLKSHWFRKAMGHELTHFYQHLVWRNIDAPVTWEKGAKTATQLNSFDRKLWALAVEGQADLFSEIINNQYESKSWEDLSDLGNNWPAFVFGSYLQSDDFHPRTYNIKGARCDDGRAMTAEEFVNAFGNIPGKQENFLKPWIRSRDDIYAIFAKNPMVLEAAKQGGCSMQDPPPEAPPAPGVS